MAVFKYSLKEKQKHGKAQLHDIDASYKDLTQVCKVVKNKSVSQARKVLNDAVILKKAIRYHKFAKGLGHRSELGGKRGRYPKKECKFVLALLENAVANAIAKGLDETKLFVTHAAAFKQNTFKRYRRTWAGSATLGYGKQAVWSDYVTARAELVVVEKEGVKNEALHGKKKKEQKKEEKKETGEKTEKKEKPIKQEIREDKKLAYERKGIEFKGE